MKKTKITQNHVLFIFAFLLFLISGVYSIDCRQIMTAYAFSDHIILSEMSEEQCIDFIEENNIEIPNELISSPELGELIKITIETIEFDPTYNFSYDNDETQQFFNNIKELVNGYYGINEIEDYPSDTGYMLQYNWVLNDSGEWVTIGGAWDDSWEYYNCYAYAIGMTENIPITDDFPRGFDPGYFAYGQSCFNSSMSISDLADVVKQDLGFLGYDVEVFDDEPSNIAPNETLICVRKGDEDYHFMRKGSDGYWYHKPGVSAPLRYQYHPEDRTWIRENSYHGVEIGMSNVRYNSEIYYITYSGTPFNFSVTNEEAAIIGLHENAVTNEEIIIPVTITRNGYTYPVTSINANAFLNCDWIENITFEDNSQLTDIAYNAFKGCISLKNITLPASITTIGNEAFAGCTNLRNIILDNASIVPSIGINCFSNINNFNICVPSVLENAFKIATNWSNYANNITRIYFEDGVYYVIEDKIISIAEYTELVTLASFDFNDIWTNAELHAYDEGFIGVGGGRCFYVSCIMEYEFDELIACSLKIEVEAQTSCLLFNSEKAFVAECFIEEGILSIPYLEIYNSGGGFYLLPLPTYGQAIQFELSDISLEYTAIVYI